ncbi:aminoacylase-1 precursor [Iris pallida]|uniref:N-acyl-aliphatic-L-amino acid amidohydrolase n=1 Tax=Iris pallida TaxID=29817 RepID=A0AAX6E774_IRIPA|nr:aminoacylase-1 precursor [Iris pallida]
MNKLLLILLPLALFFFSGSAEEEPAEAIISRFQEYLRIDTAHPTPDYSAAVKFLLSQTLTLESLRSQTLEFVPGKPLLLLEWRGSDTSLPSLLLNSHTDVVPSEPSKWLAPPLSASLDPSTGNILARGSQDMKCVGLQYLEAVRRLLARGFSPLRTVYLSFVPDEEVGGHNGAKLFSESEIFGQMNVGVVLDEGLASPGEEYRVFYGERCPWWTTIRATGPPGHGAKLYDGSAAENLARSLENVMRFRRSQLDRVKSGEVAEGEAISVNLVYLKAGTPTPTGFVMNLQPSEAEAGLDIRVPPNADTVALERRIAEEWAPSSRNMTFEFKEKASVNDKFGKPLITVADSSSPWWGLLKEAVKKAGGKLGKPEIFPASTDARFFRELGIPAFGFSPMANTPILLHDHNEFLNKDEYLKGIEVYESIIEAFASYNEHAKDSETRAEL